MVAALLGKKVGMTQVFDQDGRCDAVTVIQAGPCVVLQVKSQQDHGYEAVQLGYEEIKAHRSTKPLIGHCLKAQVGPRRHIREFRLPGAAEHQVGEELTVQVFEESNIKYVDITGTTKGRGFAGGMKRHGFGGQPRTHGVKRRHRSQGSINGHASEEGDGGGIKKGKRMAGHMGNARCTVRNHTLVGIDKERNLLLIRGAIPGPNGGVVLIRASKGKN